MAVVETSADHAAPDHAAPYPASSSEGGGDAGEREMRDLEELLSKLNPMARSSSRPPSPPRTPCRRRRRRRTLQTSSARRNEQIRRTRASESKRSTESDYRFLTLPRPPRPSGAGKPTTPRWPGDAIGANPVACNGTNLGWSGLAGSDA